MNVPSEPFGPLLLKHRGAVLAFWCLVVAVAAVTALSARGAVTGVATGIPGSASMAAIERAVNGGIPAGTFFPFLVVLRSDSAGVFDPVFA